MPKVTVAIPTYNRSNYLPEAIGSVLSQTFQDYELLILDNASTDNTAEVVKSFNDERIRYVRNDVNVGVWGNCNKAHDLAQGEYVIIFHDDDVMEPGLLEAEVNILDEHENVVLVGANARYMDGKGKLSNAKIYARTDDVIFGTKKYMEEICRNGDAVFACPTVMLRRSFLQEHQLTFRNEVGPGADAYLWCEVSLSGKELYCIAKPLLRYRIHNNQGSKTNFPLSCMVLLYQHTYKLILDSQFSELLPVYKRRVTHLLLSALLVVATQQNMNKKTLMNEIEALKQEVFWSNEIRMNSKIKLFLAANFPKLARGLHRVKHQLKGTL